MASRTQMRLAQLTGSFGLLPGQISDQRPEQSAASVNLLLMSSASLLGPLTEMASAIRRIHGGGHFANSSLGQFHVDIVPATNNAKDLGSDSRRFAEAHTTKLFLAGAEINALDADLSSVSANHDTVPSAKVVKDYVDAQITAQDLDGVADSGTFAVDLDSQSLTINGGTGLTSSASDQTVSIALDNTAVSAASYGGALKRLTATVDAQGRLTAMGEATIADASTSAKGVASFASGDFAASSGAITIKTSGVDFAQIQNVAASSVMGVIGNSAAAPADIAIETTLAGANTKLARADAIKTYADGNLGGKALDQSARAAGHVIVWDNTQDRWESSGIAGVGNQTAIALSDGLVTVGLANSVTIQQDLTVTGDLIVSGDQIVANVTDLQIEDKQIELNSPANGSPISNQGAGLFISGSDSSKDIIYNVVADGGEFRLNTDHGVALGKAYFVNGNNVLNQTTLGSTVLASSLTSVGALTGGSIAAAFGNINNGSNTLDSGAATLASLEVTAASVLNGNVALGSDVNDLITPNGVFAGDLVPNDGTRKLGNPGGNKWAELHIAGEAVIDNLKLDGNTIISTDANGNIDLTPNGTGEVNISKVDIDSGAIDGAIIGASAAAAGTFTALDCTDKAFAITNLDFGSTAVAIEAGDEFVISDASDNGNGKKATIEAIQTFLAANGSQKHVLLQASGLAAGAPLDVGALAGITASLWHAAAEKQQEVYCNGQLLARGGSASDGMDWYKHSVTGQIMFGFGLEADDVLQFVLRG
jgi:hypothetical protein